MKYLNTLFIASIVLLSSCGQFNKFGVSKSDKKLYSKPHFIAKKKSVTPEKSTSGEKISSPELNKIETLKIEDEYKLASLDNQFLPVPPIEFETAVPPVETLSKKELRKQLRSLRKDIRKQDTVKQTHGMAIASLVSGIVGVFIAGIPLGILAIVFGGIAVKRIKDNPDMYSGRGMAIAGIILGIVSIVGAIVVVALLVS